jgi:hypothetical protein
MGPTASGFQHIPKFWRGNRGSYKPDRSHAGMARS